jgi:thiol-disulfide isomerase/thioredoxin
MTGLYVAAAVLIAAVALGLLRRSRDGIVRATSVSYDFASLGVQPGRITLLQFSSAFCAPCQKTAAVLRHVAATSDVDHVEIDVTDRLELAKALRIWRTPTTLIIDASGNVAGRAAGIPTLAQVRESIGALHD